MMPLCQLRHDLLDFWTCLPDSGFGISSFACVYVRACVCVYGFTAVGSLNLQTPQKEKTLGAEIIQKSL